jgi:hypothetical protein
LAADQQARIPAVLILGDKLGKLAFGFGIVLIDECNTIRGFRRGGAGRGGSWNRFAKNWEAWVSAELLSNCRNYRTFHLIRFFPSFPRGDPSMKIKVLIWLGLCIQSLFLIFWLFRTPEISGELKVARDELQKGDSNLPALTVRNPDSTVTTVAYDPTKSVSENLVARAKARLSMANRGYESVVGIPLVVTLLNMVLLIVSLWSLRTKKPT